MIYIEHEDVIQSIAYDTSSRAGTAIKQGAVVLPMSGPWAAGRPAGRGSGFMIRVPYYVYCSSQHTVPISLVLLWSMFF